MPYTPPTVTDIRDQSMVVFAEFGFPAPTGTDPDPLQRLLDEALAEFHGTMREHAGVAIDFGLIDETTDNGKTVSTLITKAIRMWVEWLAAASDPSIVDVVADWDILQSGTGRSHRQISPNLQMWHLWPQLDRILRFLVPLYKLEIDVTDLPDDVPQIDHVGKYPKPGADLMRELGIPPYPSYPAAFPGGVAWNLFP